uniref:Prefoldin subunit 1 n=1 Tax=Spongospora subterranea TaxID=70186 RepID=A0A0H5RKU3_9EUKA|eukprot:CRZ09334.1 hypothetical protein [Spongospora subterranea]
MASATEASNVYTRYQEEAWELNRVETLLSNKIATIRRNRLTLEEISIISQDNPSFVSIGRMFLQQPLPTIQADIHSANSNLEEEAGKLESTRTYLQRSVKERKDAYDELIRSMS